MSSEIRTRLRKKTEGFRHWEECTLPQAEEMLLLKSLSGGEYLAIQTQASPDGERVRNDVLTLLTIMYSAHDPATHERIWNPEIEEDRAEVGEWHPDDITHVATEVMRISGLLKSRTEGKEDASGEASEPNESSSTSSPSVLAAA